MAFIDEAPLSIFSFNCQSLKAHAPDLEDSITQKFSVLLLCETWLSNEETVNMKNFIVISQYKRPNKRAGGVAIFKNNECTSIVTPRMDVLASRSQLMNSESNADIGDICAAEYQLNNCKILLISVYISPNTPISDIIENLHRILLQYTPDSSRLINDSINLQMIPILLCGDFNVNFSSENAQPLLDFMEEKLLLRLVNPRNEGTTRYGTTLDAIFARHIENIQSMLYISYCSYHKPILATLDF